MRQSRFQEGVEKSIDFRDPLFFRFCLILGAQGAGSKMFFGCCFASFLVQGAICFDRAQFSAIFMDFDGLGTIFA